MDIKELKVKLRNAVLEAVNSKCTPEQVIGALEQVKFGVLLCADNLTSQWVEEWKSKHPADGTAKAADHFPE